MMIEYKGIQYHTRCLCIQAVNSKCTIRVTHSKGETAHTWVKCHCRRCSRNTQGTTSTITETNVNVDRIVRFMLLKLHSRDRHIVHAKIVPVGSEWSSFIPIESYWPSIIPHCQYSSPFRGIRCWPCSTCTLPLGLMLQPLCHIPSYQSLKGFITSL